MSKFTCLGSGVIVTDVICKREYPEGPEKQRKYIENLVREEVGGTCGNVMTMLPYLGVQTFPVAKLDDSPKGYELKESLKKFGADVRFVRNIPGGGTTFYHCTHKLTKEGDHKLSCTRSSTTSALHPNLKFMNTKNGELDAFLEQLDFVPDVFFFDNPASAHEKIARLLRDKGTLVYFEPEGIEGGKLRPFLTRVEASDIVKFSAERITDDSWTAGFQDKLFLKTMGEQGVAFSLRGGEWKIVPPQRNDHVVDTEGAGDWTTSVFISELCKGGYRRVADLTEEIVEELLSKAQAVASKSVGYMCPKGMIHEFYD